MVSILPVNGRSPVPVLEPMLLTSWLRHEWCKLPEAKARANPSAKAKTPNAHVNVKYSVPKAIATICSCLKPT